MSNPSIPPAITSAQNPRIKQAVRLKKRSVRDESGLLLVEGYREVLRALENGWNPNILYYCPELYLGKHEGEVVALAQKAGAECLSCSEAPFRKMAYRERPEGLLALGPQVRTALEDIHLGPCPLLLVAEAIEKPGNLGTMLRTADAAGLDAVIVCDRCTDINNPNVVRSSIGTLFSRPVVEAGSRAVRDWLRDNGIQVVAATPHSDCDYTRADLTGPSAILMGTEQVGLSEEWLKAADVAVRIPMLGQADSLNVSAASTILLYEAIRQRQAASQT